MIYNYDIIVSDNKYWNFLLKYWILQYLNNEPIGSAVQAGGAFAAFKSEVNVTTSDFGMPTEGEPLQRPLNSDMRFF